MIQIGIPEIAVTARYEDTAHRSIRYDAEAVRRPRFCTNPRCGHKITPNRHDARFYFLHDTKSEGKLVFINLKIRRYKCRDCGYVFPDEFTFFAKRRHLTRRLEEELAIRRLRGETWRTIALDYSLDPRLVARTCAEYCRNHTSEDSLLRQVQDSLFDPAHAFFVQTDSARTPEFAPSGSSDAQSPLRAAVRPVIQDVDLFPQDAWFAAKSDLLFLQNHTCTLLPDSYRSASVYAKNFRFHKIMYTV